MSCVSSIAKIERVGKLTDLVHPTILNCHTRIHYFYRTIKRERSRKATSLLIRCMYQETKPCFVSMRTVLHLSTYLTPTECGRRSVTSNC